MQKADLSPAPQNPFEDSKVSYYETLKASSHNCHSDKHDIRPWLNYFWGALLRAYREFEEHGCYYNKSGFKNRINTCRY